MQGFRLAQPFKPAFKAELPSDINSQIIKGIGKEPQDWAYGWVNAISAINSVVNLNKTLISKLNNFSNSAIWELSCPSNGGSSFDKFDIAFGKGSIGTHVDEMTGVSMLVLLFCSPWKRVPEESNPEFNGEDGEFISAGKVLTAGAGDIIVFDDREPHAWLTNSAWAFAVFPLFVTPKKSCSLFWPIPSRIVT